MTNEGHSTSVVSVNNFRTVTGLSFCTVQLSMISEAKTSNVATVEIALGTLVHDINRAYCTTLLLFVRTFCAFDASWVVSCGQSRSVVLKSYHTDHHKPHDTWCKALYTINYQDTTMSIEMVENRSTDIMYVQILPFSR